MNAMIICTVRRRPGNYGSGQTNRISLFHAGWITVILHLKIFKIIFSIENYLSFSAAITFIHQKIINKFVLNEPNGDWMKFKSAFSELNNISCCDNQHINYFSLLFVKKKSHSISCWAIKGDQKPEHNLNTYGAIWKAISYDRKIEMWMNCVNKH